MRVREVFGGLTVSPACLACLGRAFATKAMVFSLLYARLFYAHKKTSPALLSCRQKKSRILCIFGLIVRKKYQAIRLVGWLVGWLVGCKFYANYLYFCNHLPCLRTFPFQILHTYLTAIRGNCKVRFLDLMGKFLEGLGGFLGVSHSPINSIIFASGHKSFGKIDISSLCLRTIRTGVIVLS